MKQSWLLFLLLVFQGCLYFNDTGVSAHLYDNCREYYDNCGTYHKECPPNLINYEEVGEGLQEIGNEIKTKTTQIVRSIRDNLSKECRESTDTAQ